MRPSSQAGFGVPTQGKPGAVWPMDCRGQAASQ